MEQGCSPRDHLPANPGPLRTSRPWASGKVVTWGPGGARTWLPGDHLRVGPGHQGTSSGLLPAEPRGGWISGNQVWHGVAPSGTTGAGDPGSPGTTQGRTQPRGHVSIMLNAERKGCRVISQRAVLGPGPEHVACTWLGSELERVRAVRDPLGRHAVRGIRTKGPRRR